MKRVAHTLGRRQLSSKEFAKHANFTAKPVISRFGSWQEALREAGLEPCEKAVLDSVLSVDKCVHELQRVANLLKTRCVKRADLDRNSKYSAYRVTRACGGWNNALSMAGLLVTPNYRTLIPIETLAASFLDVVVELQRIPTLVQLSRRSGRAPATLSRNRGGYPAFKAAAIKSLLSSSRKFPKGVCGMLRDELARLHVSEPQGVQGSREGTPHRQGRLLGFRCFAYAPTSEHDVRTNVRFCGR